MAKVEVKHSGAATHIFVDRKEIHFVREYTLHQVVGMEIPEIILELNLADHKNEHSFENANVQYSEDTIRQAISVLRTELLRHGYLYSGFRESIQSVLKQNERYVGDGECEIRAKFGSYYLAEEILKRIIGEE